LLIIVTFFLLGIAPAAGAGATQAATPAVPETTIVSANYDRRVGSIGVFGLAAGDLSGIELAIRRSDGWFWDADALDWRAEPVWQKNSLMPSGPTTFVWDESIPAPSGDGDSLLLLARALSRDGRPDPKPAGARVFIDNIKPVVGKFDIEGARWSGSREATLSLEVSGAADMRLAESRLGLNTAKKLHYRDKIKFRFSQGDGPKMVYAAFSDRAGNRTIVPISGGSVGLDTAPPVVNRFAPAAEAKSVSVGAKISAGFIDGSGIDATTVKSDFGPDATFYLTQGSHWTTATVAYDRRNKTAVLTPAEPMVKGQIYTAHLKPGIKDMAGNAFDDEISWSFRAVEPSPPETKLDNLPELVSGKAGLMLTGSAGDPDGVSAVGVFVRDEAGLYWDSPADTWTTEPFANEARLARRGRRWTGWEWRWPLPGSDGARFVVTAAAKDRFLAEDPTPAGGSLRVDNQPPRIERLILQKDQAVTASDTIAISSFVTGAAEMRFAADRAGLESRKWQPFSVETSFALPKKEGQKEIFGQWRDEFGNRSRIGAAGSRGTIILDKTGPKVSSTYPHDQAGDVNVSVMITANFDEISLDETWITTDTFTLLGPDSIPVPAKVTFDRASKTATLTPLEFLRYGKGYRAILSGRIKDRLGNAIGHGYGWTFTTVALSTHPPSSPRDLAVVSTERGDKVSWLPPSGVDKGGDFDPPIKGGYNIYRAPAVEGPFELVNRLPVSELTYYDRDYDRPGRRFYMVKAVDAGGSEGEGSPVNANDDIDTVFKIEPDQAATVTPSNDVLRLRLPVLERPITLHIKTGEALGAPASPMRAFELDSSPTVKLKNLSLVLPGDPLGAIIMKEEEGGWQPLSDVTYSRDPLARVIAAGPVSSSGRYLVVDRADATPPPAAPAVKVSSREGKPFITWSKVDDPDSGIRSYRLWRTETTMTFETSTTTAAVNLPAAINRFLDNTAEPGRNYYYWVVGVNGADLPGPLGGADPTIAPRPMVDHRPRVAGVTNCRSCHIEKRVQNELELIDCRLCHDGTGSLIIITGYDSGSSLCRSCHALTRGELDRAGGSPAERCGGCHTKGDSPIVSSDNGHTGRSGLDSMTCSSCHSLHRPGDRKSGYLVDPLNVRRSWSGSKSDFCLACHRETGWPAAVESLERFVARDVIFSTMESGRLFPGWSKTGWKRSAHQKVAGCLTCHEPHKSPNARLVAFRAKGRKYIYFSEFTASEAVCYECHRPGGPRGAADLLTLSRAPSTHSSNTFSVHSDVETASQLGVSNRHINCNDCHNVHESQLQRRQPFSNKVSGVLKGVPGVEPLPGGAGIPPAYTEVYASGREYQICLKCHSSYVKEPPAGMIDYALEFNPANLSYHPVEARGKNRGIKPAAFANSWDQKATMYCSDCHTYPAETGVARGPHGSKFKPMLAGEFGPSAAAGRQDDLCYLCHNQKTYKDDASGSRFEGRGGHADHIAKNKVSCFRCHETHGSSFSEHLIKIVQPSEASGTVGFSHDTTGGACVAACHSRPADAYRYKHAY